MIDSINASVSYTPFPVMSSPFLNTSVLFIRVYGKSRIVSSFSKISHQRALSVRCVNQALQWNIIKRFVIDAVHNALIIVVLPQPFFTWNI